MRVGEARGGEVYMRKERHLMATVKIQSPQLDGRRHGRAGSARDATAAERWKGHGNYVGSSNYLGVAEILADVKLEHHFAIRKATYKPPPQSTPTP